MTRVSMMSVGVPRIPQRRWPRRLLVLTNLLVASCLVAVAAGYGYVRYRIAQLKTATCKSCTTTTKATSGGIPVMNILLIGSNTRTGLDPGEAAQFGSASAVPGARSDVTMIIHLDPKSGSVSLLSIPRDLFVHLPPHSVSGSVGKIDATLNDGPDNLIAAIQDSLGIPINHYIEVNFDGFQRSIDAMGGVKMSFPMPLRDTFSNLRITQTGCQSLNGATALAVVRARHLQYFANGRWNDDPLSDLARIRRDHTFLRIFADTARAQVSDPLKLNSLAAALLAQVTVDSGLNASTLLGLFKHFRHLDLATAPQTTLPISVVTRYNYGDGFYGDVDFPVEPLDHQVIAAWQGQQPDLPSPQSTPLALSNVSGVTRQAATIATGLAAAGYPISGTSTGSVVAAPTETLIRYPGGGLSAAMGLQQHLSGAVMLVADPSVAAGTLAVDVGSSVAVVSPATQVTSPLTSTTTQASGSTTTTSTLPTPNHLPPSSAQDQAQPFDPTVC